LATHFAIRPEPASIDNGSEPKIESALIPRRPMDVL
jgi:hypothetical protein